MLAVYDQLTWTELMRVDTSGMVMGKVIWRVGVVAHVRVAQGGRGSSRNPSLPQQIGRLGSRTHAQRAMGCMSPHSCPTPPRLRLRIHRISR